MKRILLIVAVLTALTFPAVAQTWTGKCIGITDGDTITVLHNGGPERIRLHGIDCPERRQPFGNRAKQFTSDLVFRKTVRVEPVTTDRYGRTVARVFVDGINVNEALVKEGLAWCLRKYAPNDRGLGRLESDARSLRWGLWSNPDQMTPRVRLHSQRKRYSL